MLGILERRNAEEEPPSGAHGRASVGAQSKTEEPLLSAVKRREYSLVAYATDR